MVVKKEILHQPCPICGDIMTPVSCCEIACPKKHGRVYPRYRTIWRDRL